jgi:hypothetical protein
VDCANTIRAPIPPFSGYDQFMVKTFPKTTKPQLGRGLPFNGAEGGILQDDFHLFIPSPEYPS